MMFGKRPYLGKNRKEIRDAIIADQIHIKKCDIPEGWSVESADFINKCLSRNPATRLGSSGGTDELKQH